MLIAFALNYVQAQQKIYEAIFKISNRMKMYVVERNM